MNKKLKFYNLSDQSKGDLEFLCIMRESLVAKQFSS